MDSNRGSDFTHSLAFSSDQSINNTTLFETFVNVRVNALLMAAELYNSHLCDSGISVSSRASFSSS